MSFWGSFASGFQSGWSMVDGLLKDLNEAQKTAGAEAEVEAWQVANARRAGDGWDRLGRSGERTAMPEDDWDQSWAPEEMPPYASTEGIPRPGERRTSADGSNIAGQLGSLNAEYTSLGSSWDSLNSNEIAQYIRQRAPDFGIDGDAAVRVAMTEGLGRNRVHGQSTVERQGRGSAGGREDSWGPFQLYLGGGLGNEFKRRTGLDPRDPSTWREQVDFSLQEAARLGHWYDPNSRTAGPWFGPRDEGIPHNFGIQGRQGANAAPQMIDMEEIQGAQPTMFAASGGAIPDQQQGQTTWQRQNPDTRGSVFLQHETRRPTQALPGPQFPSQQPPPQQGAIPDAPARQSFADRFRELRANRADYVPFERPEPQAPQPSQFDTDEWDNRMYWERRHMTMENARNAPTRHDEFGNLVHWADTEPVRSMRNYQDFHHRHGLRTDPSGEYLVRPPTQWSGPQWQEYLRLPRADDSLVRRTLVR